MFKIVVPIKQVESLDDEFELDPGSREVDPDFVDRELNDWDTFSVEAAVAIKESLGEAEVAVITVGDEDSEEALVDCLARGADRAIRVSSEHDGPPDPLQIASLLAGAARRESPDLVLCGVQSSDAASSATGVALAAHLDLPHVAVVRRIELLREERKVRVEREPRGWPAGGAAAPPTLPAHGPDRDQRATLRDAAGDQAGGRRPPGRARPRRPRAGARRR